LKLIRLAQDRDQWRALVNTIVNCRVRKMLDNFLEAERLFASHVITFSSTWPRETYLGKITKHECLHVVFLCSYFLCFGPNILVVSETDKIADA
jgi:hypothetical protein